MIFYRNTINVGTLRLKPRVQNWLRQFYREKTGTQPTPARVPGRHPPPLPRPYTSRRAVSEQKRVSNPYSLSNLKFIIDTRLVYYNNGICFVATPLC
jgi:hypothetical protein